MCAVVVMLIQSFQDHGQQNRVNKVQITSALLYGIKEETDDTEKFWIKAESYFFKEKILEPFPREIVHPLF